MDLRRTFHTVGQGAFYSEQFESEKGKKFTVVYDCGSITKGIGSRSLDAEENKGLRRKIKSDLGNQKVDILFISHFDTDHINGCKFLDPKVVIISLISEEEINILSVISTITDGETQIDILRSPENYFRNSRIIRVSPAEEGVPNNLDRILIDFFEEEQTLAMVPDIIDSGQSIQIGTSNHPSQKAIWVYVPYNPNWRKYYDEFTQKIKAHKDLDYDKINKAENGAYVKSHIKELREIYSKLGHKNKHSLVVYSGSLILAHACLPVQFLNSIPLNLAALERLYEGRPYDYIHYHRNACIYYGDITIEDRWFTEYRKFLNSSEREMRVGTVQIPHHGARSGRGDLGVTQDSVFSVISVGDSNTYGHPSAKVIGGIIRKWKIPVMVTERNSSIFIQNFYF